MCWLALLGGLTLVAAGWFAFPLSHLFSPMSFNYSEGWNAYWDEAARLGQPLYAAPPDLNITNYPPVSFHLVGLLGRFVGDVNLAGRGLALFCLAWSALNVASAAAMIGGSKRIGAYAALCFLLWLAMLTPGRLATNDPSFLGLALSTLGLCAYLRAEGRVVWVVAAALFFVTAIFVKNNLVAFPLATALHLVLTRRIRRLVLFAAACAVTGALFIALAIGFDGRFFLAHLLAPRALSRTLGLESFGAFYTALYAPVLIGLGWLLWSRSPARSLLTLCFACSALLAISFGFGNGVAGNVHYETLGAMAILVAAAVSTVQRSVAGLARGWVLVAIVALMAVAPALLRTPGELYGTLGRAERLPQREADYAAALSVIKSAPDPALCESLLMCFQAAKPFAYDPYFVKDQVSIGRIPEARIIAELNARHYAAVQIGEDDPSFAVAEGERLRFSPAVVSALLANYRVAQQSRYYAVLLPK